MSQKDDDTYVIPWDWLEARPYLERRLEERRVYRNAREEHMERRMSSLTERVEETQQELHGVRDGVRQLNESFRHVSEQNNVLMQMVNHEGAAQSDRWQLYEDEQRKQTRLIADGYNIIKREDSTRFPMRLVTLILLLLLLFSLVAEKL
jgi:hypothetical protein